MTAIKCLLVGEIKRHVTLREDELDTDQQLRDVVMKYAVYRRIEKERGNIAMEVDAAMDIEAADKNSNTGSINASSDNYGRSWDEQWTWDQVNYINKGKGQKGNKGKSKGKGGNYTGPYRGGKDQGKYGSKGSGKDNSKGGTKGKNSTVFTCNCWTCGAVGHSSKNCPTVNKGFPYKCNNCEIVGHKASQ